MMQATSRPAEKSLSDEALLARILRQDSAALELLYDRHAQTVYSLLLRIVRDQAVAEELLQETFFQVWSKAEQFQGSGAVAAWLYRIARNKALDQLRRQKVRPQVAPGEQDALEDVAAPAQDVELQVDQIWNRQHIRQALAQIPEEQRICLEMAYFDGMSQRQISDYTRTPIGTIKTRIRMGMNRLERLLRAVGYP
jgi:RNA polymerase sigma-70 factor, ECF subfamily